MKYNDFCEAQSAWRFVQNVVDVFRHNDDVQIVAETSTEWEYWLMQKIAGQTKYVMTWCYDTEGHEREDVEFNTLDEVERWLFEQYTDGIIVNLYCEGM